MRQSELVSQLRALFAGETKQHLAVFLPFDGGNLHGSLKRTKLDGVWANVKGRFVTNLGRIKAKVRSKTHSEISFDSNVIIPCTNIKLGVSTNNHFPLSLKSVFRNNFMGWDIAASAQLRCGGAIAQTGIRKNEGFSVLGKLGFFHRESGFGCEFVRSRESYSIEILKERRHRGTFSAFVEWNRTWRSIVQFDALGMLSDDRSTLALLTSWTDRSLELITTSQILSNLKIGFCLGASEMGQHNAFYAKAASLWQIDEDAFLRGVIGVDRSLCGQFCVKCGDSMKMNFYTNSVFGGKKWIENKFGCTISFHLDRWDPPDIFSGH
jgi:hypothetical protein